MYLLTISGGAFMASIISKKIKNHIYYYYVESKRINGKPKMVNQKYLGTAEKLLETVLSAEKPLEDRVLHSEEVEFGAVALAYDIADRLGITEIIDSFLPKRKQGASIGMYILTAAINRVVNPTSKSGLSDWFADTCLPFITGCKPSLFTPQNFWNNTSISADDVDRIEEAILRKVIDTYQIDTTHIIYDATNFFTYVDTMQNCELPKRGHSKEKRNDLRIVGLSLMVSPDFSIPLLHETYPGNRADAKEFPVMMERLKTRYEAITNRASDVTVVFDRGNNSGANIELLESGEFMLHYVGGLKENEAQEMFAIDHDEYVPLCSPTLEGQSAYRREMVVYGRNAIVVIVYNPELEKGQMQGILINRQKVDTKLLVLQQKLMRRAAKEITKGKKPTVESVTSAVEKILSVEYMRAIFEFDVTEKDGNIYLAYEVSDERLERLRNERLGKTVLFTDRKDFSNEQIVLAYRSAWHVEAAFKQLKDTKHLTVRPIFHWTDEKIRVHIFSCVLAYRLCTLLVKELFDNGVSVSVNRLIDEVSRIKRIHTFFRDANRIEKVESFTLGSKLAEQIEQLYKLKEKYS
jgi:transposase